MAGSTLNQKIAQRRETISRDELSTIIDILTRDDFGEEVFVKPLKIPVSRRCVAEISFSKLPTCDEWDALLAHIAFYKTWFSESPEPHATAEQVADKVCLALDERESGKRPAHSVDPEGNR